MEFSSEQDAILKDAIEFYGYDRQKDMLHEEMGEIMQAFNKYKRDPSEKTENNLKEELVDVILLARQFEHFFGPEEIKSLVEFKTQRLSTRLENSKSTKLQG